MARGIHAAIDSCIADSCRKDGFKVSRMSHVSVVNSLAVNSGRYGIHLTKGSYLVSLEGNVVVDSGFLHKKNGSGIVVAEKDGQRPMYVRIHGNRVHNAYFTGVQLFRALNVEIEKTTISNNVNRDSYCFVTKKTEAYTMVSNVCDAVAEKKILLDGGQHPAERCVGLSAAGACCPKVCGTCGGTGCSSRLPLGSCCTSEIKKLKKKCMFNEPPCLM